MAGGGWFFTLPVALAGVRVGHGVRGHSTPVGASRTRSPMATSSRRRWWPPRSVPSLRARGRPSPGVVRGERRPPKRRLEARRGKAGGGKRAPEGAEVFGIRAEPRGLRWVGGSRLRRCERGHFRHLFKYLMCYIKGPLKYL